MVCRTLRETVNLLYISDNETEVVCRTLLETVKLLYVSDNDLGLITALCVLEQGTLILTQSS